MKLKVRNTSGKVVATTSVRDDVFGVPSKPALVHQVMVSQLSNARQGTAKTKTRADVSGGGRKPHPQKHTGAARAGTIRAPHWRGGGVVFGIQPRNYRHRTPKRMRRLALVSSLSEKVREDKLVVLESLVLDQPKTQEMAVTMNSLGANNRVLLVADGSDGAVIRTARNLERVEITPARLLNAVHLLKADTVIMTIEAVRTAEKLWGNVRHKRNRRLLPVPQEKNALS